MINIDETKITRVEVIGPEGRLWVGHDLLVDPRLQDDGRTLKLFVYEQQKLPIDSNRRIRDELKRDKRGKGDTGKENS